MPAPTTITVVPTSYQRRGFQKWAGPRGIATLPGNGFAVPVELLGEVPTDLIVGARVNGEVYLPAPGEVRYDAPPVEPLEGLGAVLAQPALEVVAGFPTPDPDPVPTTGSPVDFDDSP